MLRKKGRYILILLLIIFIWSYNHKKSKYKEQLSKNITTLIDAIRVQDYFKISMLLDNNSSKHISIDDIKNFTQNFTIDRDFDIKIKDIDDDKVIATFKDKTKEYNLTIVLKDENNTIKYQDIKIDNQELKSNSQPFPIATSIQVKEQKRQ